MPKTKDAFALKDFDETRILQRQFFKDFNFDIDKTDAEILQSLEFDFNPYGNTENRERFLEFLGKLNSRVGEYQEHIKRHSKRLIKYARGVERKITVDPTADIESLRNRHKRAEQLSIIYNGIRVNFDSGEVELVGYNRKIDDSVELLSQKIFDVYFRVDGIAKMQYREVFAERLKQARKMTGLTQARFAPKIGLTKNGYALYETARRDPSIPTLIRIAKELKISADWLLGLT